MVGADRRPRLQDGLTVRALVRCVKTDSDNGHFDVAQFDGGRDRRRSLWGGGLFGFEGWSA